MKSILHCRAITCTPVVAQTTLQVKLDSKLEMFTNATPVLDDLITNVTTNATSLVTNLTTNASSIFSAFFTTLPGSDDGPGLIEQMLLSVRTIPWKT